MAPHSLVTLVTLMGRSRVVFIFDHTLISYVGDGMLVVSCVITDLYICLLH